MTKIAAALAMTMLLAGPAFAQPAFPPPPPEGEPPPPPPGPPERWVIEPGHWHWDGYRYDWIRRHWIAVRPGYAHFIPGHWNPGGVWIAAHWAP